MNTLILNSTITYLPSNKRFDNRYFVTPNPNQTGWTRKGLWYISLHNFLVTHPNFCLACRKDTNNVGS